MWQIFCDGWCTRTNFGINTFFLCHIKTGAPVFQQTHLPNKMVTEKLATENVLVWNRLNSSDVICRYHDELRSNMIPDTERTLFRMYGYTKNARFVSGLHGAIYFKKTYCDP